MLLQDIYDLLEDGELSKHPLLVNGVTALNQAKINKFVDQGLIDLYSRFPLKVNQLTLLMHEEIVEYPIRKEFAFSQVARGADYFIEDSMEFPFGDDLIKVLSITDEACCTVPLNDRNACYAAYTIQPDVLYIPTPLGGEVMFVTYQAKHAKVTSTDTGVTKLELPSVFVSALCSYIGYRLYSGSTEVTAAGKSNQFYAQYEQACNMQRLNGTANFDDGSTNECVFLQGGWV